jgi:hypothetical protein
MTVDTTKSRGVFKAIALSDANGLGQQPYPPRVATHDTHDTHDTRNPHDTRGTSDTNGTRETTTTTAAAQSPVPIAAGALSAPTPASTPTPTSTSTPTLPPTPTIAPTTAPTPTLSIVISIDSQRQRGTRCLRSVLAQRGVERLEIILQDAGHADFAPIDGSAHPRVRVLPMPRGLSYGEALVRGVHAARAPIVAFLEEHVVALPGWADAIIAAHADDRPGAPWAGVGSEMYLDNPGRGASDMIDLFAVGPWMAPAVAGDAPALRWQNTSYKRDVLLSYGDRLPRFLDVEGVFFTQLRADGHRLWIEPSAKLRHASERQFRLFLRGAFVSNRLGAATRAELLRFTPMKRLLCAGAALVNIARAPGYILRGLSRSPGLAGKHQLARRRLPHIVIYSVSFCLGACTGFLFGRGRAGQRFLEYELNAVRDIRGYEQPPLA